MTKCNADVPIPNLQFWNIKLVPTKRSIDATAANSVVTPSASAEVVAADEHPTESELHAGQLDSYEYLERTETPYTLRDKQKYVEAQVYRIWTVLSTFEESSAACISEMLRHVSNGQYIEGVRMAENFILHVETLFAAIDLLNNLFRRVGGKGEMHSRATTRPSLVSEFSLSLIHSFFPSRYSARA